MARVIALLTGALAAKSADHVIVDVRGVGYQVHVSARTIALLPDPGTEVSLHIHTHVREDQIALFGFTSIDERTLFLRLLSVSNVGPKLAMAVLSRLAPGELVHAVAGEDLVRLSAIPGIGKKTAERIVVDLKDRLLRDHADLLQLQVAGATPMAMNDEAISALCNLGYSRQAAEKALTAVGAARETPLEAVLRLALRELARVQ